MRRLASCLALFLVAAAAVPGCRKAQEGPPAPPSEPSAARPEQPAELAGGEPPGQTARKDGDIYYEAIAPHFDRVSVYDGEETFRKEWAATPEPARHLLTAHWVVMEVSNGGFVQLFSTAAGVLVPEGILGLRALGLEENARMLEQAAAIFGKIYPRDRKVRERRLSVEVRRSGQDNPFAELDARFFETLRQQPGGFDGVAARTAQAAAR